MAKELSPRAEVSCPASERAAKLESQALCAAVSEGLMLPRLLKALESSDAATEEARARADIDENNIVGK